MIFPKRKRKRILLLPLGLPPPPPKHWQKRDRDKGTSSTPRFYARRSMFFVLFSSSLRYSLSFAFASRLRFLRLDFFVSVFSALLPPLPLPLLSFEQRFGQNDDEKEEDESSDRAFGSRWSAFEQRKKKRPASLARKNEDFECGGKRSIKMSSETRRV